MPSEYDLWDMIPKKTDETWELAYYGGTFTSLPRSVMLRYLEFGQKLRREGRIGSIRISTHPAYLDQEKISSLDDTEFPQWSSGFSPWMISSWKKQEETMVRAK